MLAGATLCKAGKLPAMGVCRLALRLAQAITVSDSLIHQESDESDFPDVCASSSSSSFGLSIRTMEMAITLAICSEGRRKGLIIFSGGSSAEYNFNTRNSRCSFTQGILCLKTNLLYFPVFCFIQCYFIRTQILL